MNKARDPPSLSYLAIFNTTLQPPGPVPEDDEDADEQAHVLFYTSRDRAASRDQMLRRVGLGKALIHFTELFQADDVCNNVHSLSKRMVILSPEPNFWILAGVDLARSIKVDADKGKENTKGKAKEQQQPSQIPNKSGLQYEYYDGSLNDIALKANLKRGYEQFKLTHGSFGSVLSISGREALELQLERFFTVWAWSWDFEEGQDFSDHLGIKIHPMHNTLTPLLDEYQKLLPEGCSSIMINPPCIIPSTNFVKQKYPPSLSRHLLSLVPQRRPEPPSKEIIEGSAPREGALKGKHVQSQTALAGPSSNPNKLLGMPAMSLNMNMNMNMDVRKWGWPGYLTFGKGVTTRKPADDKEREPSQKEGPPPPEEQVTEESEEPQGGLHRSKAIDIDQDALYDAITSANNSYSNRSDALTENLSPDEDLQGSTLTARPQAEVDEGETNMASPAVVDTMVTESVLSAPIASASSSLSRLFEQSVPEPGESEPAPEFFLINVHLPVSPEILSTRRRRVYYLVRGYAALALVVTDEGRLETQISSFAELANEVLGKAQVLVDEEATKTAPHAANIVLAKGQHIISTAGYVETNDGGFTSKSEHLYNGQQMLEKYLNVHEVFSRGQNPQHWHVARRGLGTDNDGKAVAGDVYLEVLRKEASLPDVENILIDDRRLSLFVESDFIHGSMTSTSEAALRLEIARLTGAINRAKTNNGNKGGASFPSSSTFNPSLGFKSTQYPVKQSNTYVNPSYKPISKHQLEVPVQPPVSRIPVASETKDVIIGGVTFESSGRSLVRKDLPKPATPLSKPKTFRSRAPFPHSKYGRGGKASHRPYKPKSTRGRPQRRGNRNMTLNNTLYRSVYRGTFKYLIRRARNRRIQTKRAKLANKPCPRFTTTGACSRGLTCMYQHDPNKIAICWNFLQGTCPNSPETCNLSHDPTPERTPLCMHFANNGRCTRENCPFPHIRVGARKGVCRDFAVLGYCEKGLDCAMQHVRECPDFAEKGECSTKGCKLPHVIRANRSREPAATPALDEETSKASGVVAEASSATATNHPQHPTAEEANLGDEFISLTFHESDSSDGEDEESEEADEEVDDGIVDNYEEGYEPTYD